MKLFSATRFAERQVLGETVTAWIATNPRLQIVDIVITQSSDSEFHCVTICVFYVTPVR